MLRLGTVATAALMLAMAGCSDEPAPKPKSGPAPYSAINQNTNRAVVLTPKVFRGPIAGYKRHVARELGDMLGDVRALEAAVGSNDMAGARGAWLRADSHYEAIGAAYGAFGDLDAAINGLSGGLQGGVRSGDFTGLHRIELALWQRRSLRDAAPYVERLARDVDRLRTQVPRDHIDALDFGLRAHEVLEDTLHLQLAGRASPWASNALDALASNIRGTHVVLDELAPIAQRSNAFSVVVARRRLATLSDALARLRSGNRYPRWDTLPQLQRERINALTAAAAEQLAFVPGLVDPRPPQPVKNPVAAR